MKGDPVALAKGNECRVLRRDLQRRLRSGDIDAASILCGEIPWWLAKVHMGVFLRWLPRISPTTVGAITAEAGVSEVRELGLATPRQLGAVAQLLEDRAEANRTGSSRRRVAERRERAEVA